MVARVEAAISLIIFVSVALCAFWGLPALASTPAWLIATADETARAGALITFDIVKPSVRTNWSDTMQLKLAGDGRAEELALHAIGPVGLDDTRRRYQGGCLSIFRACCGPIWWALNRIGWLCWSVFRMRSSKWKCQQLPPQAKASGDLLFRRTGRTFGK